MWSPVWPELTLELNGVSLVLQRLKISSITGERETLLIIIGNRNINHISHLTVGSAILTVRDPSSTPFPFPLLRLLPQMTRLFQHSYFIYTSFPRAEHS